MAKKIYLDAGHGGGDVGAVGYEQERELAVKIVKYEEEYLKKHYVCEVKKSKGTDNLVKRVAEANRWGADIFHSVHLNAFRKNKGDGFEACVFSAKSQQLGRTFEKYVKAVGQNSRGIKYRPDLYVLKATDMPAVLTEDAFVDTWKDIKDWNEDHELKKLGEAHAKAIAEIENLPKKKPSSGSPKAFKVKIIVDKLNYRSGAGVGYKINGQVKKNDIFTIVEEKNGWGKLKSGAGWINISSKYVKRV